MDVYEIPQPGEYERYQLRFDPSKALRDELLQPFVRPSVAKKLGVFALYSEQSLPFRRPFHLHQPSQTEAQHLRNLSEFQRRQWPSLQGHQLPILSSFRMEQGLNNARRLHFKVGLTEDERQQLGPLVSSFIQKKQRGGAVLSLVWPLYGHQLVPNQIQLDNAEEEMKLSLTIRHPAGQKFLSEQLPEGMRSPDSYRSVDPEYYVVPDRRGLINRPLAD